MQSKVVNLGNKKITVRELTVGEIKELFDMPEKCPVIDRLTFLLSKSCSGSVNQEELLKFPPSELNEFIECMLEVNQSFFDQAVKAGMTEAMAALKGMMAAISIGGLLPSSKPVTV